MSCEPDVRSVGPKESMYLMFLGYVCVLLTMCASLFAPFWCPFGGPLVPFWHRFGPLLVPFAFWSSFGSLLVPLWSPFGPLLVPFWLPVGPLLVGEINFVLKGWDPSSLDLSGHQVQLLANASDGAVAR